VKVSTIEICQQYQQFQSIELFPNHHQQSASLSLTQYQQYINDRRRQTMITGSMGEYQKLYQQEQSRGHPIVAAGFRD
jgi:hypothetical protein